jgi:SNF family Na+-dependent transporter
LTIPLFRIGIDYYLIPRNLSRLGEVDIWNEAAGQIFYSLGVGVGSQLLLSSYNDFRANAFRDALLIGFGNSL